MVFAHHAHVFPEQIRPEGTISKLLDCMDAHGIDRAVCFAPFPHHMAGAGMGNANAWLDGVISSHRDRLAAFGSVNPEAGDAPLEVSRLVDMGVKGIKLHPAAQEFAINSRRARPFYEAASDAGMVLTFHTGVHSAPITKTRPALIDDLLFDYPGIVVTLEHLGGRAFRDEAVGVLQNHRQSDGPNAPGRAYGGLTSVLAVPRSHPWRLSAEETSDIVATVGAELLIFGLDFPYNPPEHPGRLLREIRALGLPHDQYELLTGGNLRRLVG